MNKFELFIVGFVVIFLLGAASIMFTEPKKMGYDCQLAEISPDVPMKYKEACRILKQAK